MTFLLLARKYWQLVAIATLLLTVVGYCRARDAAHVREGILQEKVRALSAKTSHDSVLVVTHDTIVLRDTVRLTRTLARFDTVRATLNVHDTVAVERFVAVADSTVKACRATVSAFALSCAAKDTVIADLRGLLALRTPVAAPLSWKERLLWAAAGAAIDRGASVALSHR